MDRDTFNILTDAINSLEEAGIEVEKESYYTMEAIIEKFRYCVSPKNLDHLKKQLNTYKECVDKEVRHEVEESIFRLTTAACYIEILNMLTKSKDVILNLSKEELEDHLKNKTLITFIEKTDETFLPFARLTEIITGFDPTQSSDMNRMIETITGDDNFFTNLPKTEEEFEKEEYERTHKTGR